MKDKLRYGRGREGMVWLLGSKPPGQPPREHTHDELELNLVVSGHARYALPGGSYELKRNSLVWLFPAQPHALVDYSADFKMWILVFNRSCVRRICSGEARELSLPDPGRTFCRTLCDVEAEELERDFSRAVMLMQQEAASFNAALEFALAMSWLAYSKAGAEAMPEKLHPGVEKALALLGVEHGQELKISVLASRSGVSASSLSRLFNEELGLSIPQFRNKVRMRRLQALMHGPRRPPLSEAALKAGFGSYVQFHRVFKALYGIPPRAWTGKF